MSARFLMERGSDLAAAAITTALSPLSVRSTTTMESTLKTNCQCSSWRREFMAVNPAEIVNSSLSS